MEKKFTIADITSAVYRVLTDVIELEEEQITSAWPYIYDELADELNVDRREFEDS